jgi:hypothetical protein
MRYAICHVALCHLPFGSVPFAISGCGNAAQSGTVLASAVLSC